MLLSLIAHTIGYKTIVSAHNTIDVRCMWEVASSSPCRANDGAYNTVGVQKHGGSLTVLVMVWELMAPTIL